MRMPHITAKGVVAVAIPLVLILLIIIVVSRPSSSPVPPKQQANASATAPASQPPETPPLPVASNPEDTVADVDIGGLADAIYRFEEVVNLPPSPERDAKLQTMSTPTGYQSLVGNGTSQEAELDERAKDISFLALRSESDFIQAEPFDETSVSVTSEIRLQSSRNGEPIQTLTVRRLTTWSKINGVWKFEGEQY